MSYTFQRGETIQVGLAAVTGNVLDVTTITAKMKNLRTGQLVPFTVTARPAAGAVAAGWNFTISALDSLTLTVDDYVADAQIWVGAISVIVDPITIRVKASPTGDS